jgi:hypothetical protein
VITTTRPATERFPLVNLVMGGDHTCGVPASSLLAVAVMATGAGGGGPTTTVPADADFSAGSVGSALGLAVFAAVPLGLSLWALLDAARRPRWAWALTGRRQIVWMATICFGVLVLPIGLLASAWYLTRIRPHIRAVEDGHF